MWLSEEASAFAESHRVARLATADAAATPHVVPICYALVGGCFYFIVDDKPKHTRTGLKRLRNIAENPRVALVIDDYDEDWRRLAFLLVQGRAERVEHPTEFATALTALQARYPPYRSMALAFPTHPMVRIIPQRHHFWSAASRVQP